MMIPPTGVMSVVFTNDRCICFLMLAGIFDAMIAVEWGRRPENRKNKV